MSWPVACFPVGRVIVCVLRRLKCHFPTPTLCSGTAALRVRTCVGPRGKVYEKKGEDEQRQTRGRALGVFFGGEGATEVGLWTGTLGTTSTPLQG